MKKLLAASLALLALAAHSADDWILLADSDASTWEGRAGSLVQDKNKGGKDVVAAFGRVFDKSQKRYEFQRWYVTAEHCRLGYGKVVTMNMAGDYLWETDFVDNGGSVASALAAVLCTLVKKGL